MGLLPGRMSATLPGICNISFVFADVDFPYFAPLGAEF